MEFFIQLITKLIETITKFNSCSLNSIWSSLGTTEISLLRFLQFLFFLIFILLNICLIYTEYRGINSKFKNKSEILQSGSGSTLVPHLKKYSAYFIGAAAALSSYITIKNEYYTNASYDKKIAEYKKEIAAANEELKNVTDEHIAENMYNRLHISSIDRMFKEVLAIRALRSELQKAIAENLAELKQTGDDIWKTQVTLKQTELQAVDLNESRIVKELETHIKSGVKFSKEICKETDDQKILEMANEDIKKSTVFGVDLENLLTEFWNEFESFDGITKLAFVML
jgi:hypothetical protein